MIRILKKLFRKGDAPKKDFSEFFCHASDKEKINLLEGVVKEANADQKRFISEIQQKKI